LALVVQVVLVAEEDHLVVKQRAVDRRDGLTVEILRQSHTVDARPDVRAQLHHVEVFGHRAISGAGGGAVKDLAGRDPNSRFVKNVETVNSLRAPAYCSAIRG
jgi:hypothetical protein